MSAKDAGRAAAAAVFVAQVKSGVAKDDAKRAAKEAYDNAAAAVREQAAANGGEEEEEDEEKSGDFAGDAGPAVVEPVELLVIGAGPHGLTLMLRLLEEEPELLTEGARATLAMDDYATTAALGSWPYVKGRVTSVMKGCKSRQSHANKFLKRREKSCQKAAAEAAEAAEDAAAEDAAAEEISAADPKRQADSSIGTADAAGSDAVSQALPVPVPPVQKGKGKGKGKKKFKTVQMHGPDAAGSLQRGEGTLPLSHEMVASGKVVVLDAHGGWLSEWHRNFAAYQIPHLRSDAGIHPGPHDMRELLGFAHLTHRNANNHDLVNMVHMPRDKNKEYKGPYAMPSSSLFADYCSHLVRAYKLDNAVTKGIATNIIRERADLYTVQLASGKTIQARRVVCALGPNLRKEKMFWETEIGTSDVDYPASALAHPYDLTDWLERFAEETKQRRATEPPRPAPRVVIVGGGITSSHVVRVMLEAGCPQVTLLVRSELRERQFDIPRSWSGPGRGKLLKDFLSHSGQERSDLLREARSGGSMPPEAMVRVLEAADAGLIQLKLGVEISSAKWVGPLVNVGSGTSAGAGAGGAGRGHWTIELDTACPALECDVLLLAAGADVDIDQYPLFRAMAEQVPIPVHFGLPFLQPDLSWSPGENFYTMGAMAGLQLGPDALNLAGARHGACRIARKVRRELGGDGVSVDGKGGNVGGGAYVEGNGGGDGHAAVNNSGGNRE